MGQVRMFPCAAAGLVLATLGWCWVAVEGMPAGALSRSTGLALFGVAMLAAGWVFRGAMRAGKLPAAKTAPATGEFRRGFDKRAKATKPAARSSSEKRVVVALRRAGTEEAQRPQAKPIGMNLSADQIERIQSLLQTRAAAARARNVEQTKRQFLRNGVAVHGLAGNEGART